MAYPILTSQELLDSGTFQVTVLSDFTGLPISGAQVEIQPTQEIEAAPVTESLSTDTSGQTEIISLPAPPVELSMEPGDIQPYSEYSLFVRA